MADTALGDPPWRKEAEAHKRAMPLQRLIGNGMEHADARELHAAVDIGQRWWDAAEDIGDTNASRAREALERGHVLSAVEWFRRAAASYRFGQNPLEDADPRKPALYRKLIEAYAAAGALCDPPMQRIEVDHEGGRLAGWLQLPSRPAVSPELPVPPGPLGGRRPNVVIIFGGFDGWREEYDTGARALQARGLATCLVDLPGQGEARVLDGMYMSPDPDGVTRAVGAFITALAAHPLLGDQVGLWGNSLGGHLAARTVCREDRVSAVCINGGTDRPAEILDRFPRFVRKVQALFGVDNPDTARELVDRMMLTPELLRELSAPTLLLHGHADQIFLFSSAQRLHEACGSHDKLLLEWADGDHCIYNHTGDKHAAVGDWFADRLGGDLSDRRAPQ